MSVRSSLHHDDVHVTTYNLKLKLNELHYLCQHIIMTVSPFKPTSTSEIEINSKEKYILFILYLIIFVYM